MHSKYVLKIVLREMLAYSKAWRYSWSDFDGRMLRGQLEEIDEWSKKALASDKDIEFTEGSDFLNER